MEHSSPLAAMQPPSVLLGHCFRSDAPSSYHGFSPLSGLGGGGFNFKDLSMKRSQGDYFGTKSFRGSSPTASLAADLSQNFHIDQRSVILPALFARRLPLFDSLCLGESTNKDNSALRLLRHDGLCSPRACSGMEIDMVRAHVNTGRKRGGTLPNVFIPGCRRCHDYSSTSIFTCSRDGYHGHVSVASQTTIHQHP